MLPFLVTPCLVVAVQSCMERIPIKKKKKKDAFEQAKFEYSPLGKVFTDGLDKSDRNEGLLKRLTNIEDESNNQLLTIKNISKSALKGNVSDEYKAIQNFKQELIDKNILHLDGVKKI